MPVTKSVILKYLFGASVARFLVTGRLDLLLTRI